MSKIQDKLIREGMRALAKRRWKDKTKEEKSAHGKVMAAGRIAKLAEKKRLAACA
jgi:hypothetical protein